MAVSLFGCGALGRAPKGNLVYCSYACNGSAGLGRDYCELVADPGATPKVVVALDLGNLFNDPEIREEFPVDESVVDSVQAYLAASKVYRLNGYRLEEPISGGHSYRIHMEYSSGDKINAFWYGSRVKDQAITVYNWLEHFFSPWRSRLRSSGLFPAP